MHQLEANVDKSDRRLVSNNAVLLGLPNLENENTLQLVDKTFARIGANLPPDSIVSATRLYVSNKPNVPVPIQVAFRNSNSKETVMSRKKEVGKVLSTNIDQSLSINLF